MTQEEAVALLNEQYETCKRIYDCSADQRKSYPNVPQFMEALGMALSALRPISRERVEQVWRGCEYCSGDVDNRLYLDSKRLYLDKNGILTDEIENIDILRLEFCPKCGKPLTDEAVDMVMERMEALYGEV